MYHFCNNGSREYATLSLSPHAPSQKRLRLVVVPGRDAALRENLEESIPNHSTVIDFKEYV